MNFSTSKKIFSTILFSVIALPISMSAQTFATGGLQYKVVSENDATVEVVPPPNSNTGNTPAGACVVPAKITYNNKDYKVIGLGKDAFNLSLAMSSIELSEGIEYIGSNCFEDCEFLEEVTLPESLKKIDSYAFYNCKSIYSIYIPAGVEELGMSSFGQCQSLEYVELPSSCKELPIMGFMNTGLVDIDIPDGVESVGFGCFNSCRKLASVTFPSTLKTIGMTPFASVYSIKNVTCKSLTPPATSNNMFEESVYSNANLEVPEESVALYAATAPWNKFKNMSSVNSINVDNVTIINVDNNIVTAIESLTIYSVDGTKVVDLAAGEIAVLTPGIYLANADGKTIKFVVK